MSWPHSSSHYTSSDKLDITTIQRQWHSIGRPTARSPTPYNPVAHNCGYGHNKNMPILWKNRTTDHCNTCMATASTSTFTASTPTLNRHAMVQILTSLLRSSTWAHFFCTPFTPGAVGVSHFRHCLVAFSIKMMTIPDTTPRPLAKTMLNHIVTLPWNHILTVVSPLSWQHGTGSAHRWHMIALTSLHTYMV